MGNISENQAIELATQYLRELEKELGVDLVFVGNIRRSSDGFVFRYDGRKWVEDSDVSFALTGNEPFKVELDGTIRFLAD